MKTLGRISLAGLALALLWLTAPGFSSATFTSRSTSSATVSSAADWNPPTVTVADLASVVSGTVSVGATATDAETGVSRVVLQVAADGTGSWTSLCTDTVAPYSCSWNTTSVSDGMYDVRAIAVDNAGYSTTSTAVNTTVVNTLRVVLTNPGDLLHGTVPVAARVFNTGALTISSFKIEYVRTGGSNWSTICGNATTSVGCSWTTPASGSYDLRAVAVVGGTSYTDSATEILVDNTAPTIAVTNPGTTLSGTVTIAANATDAESGIASVTVQYTTTNGTTWTDVCTVGTAPYSCRWNTTKLPDGKYDVRAVGVDYAGNATTSPAIKGLTVNNTVNSVSLENPGAYLSSTVTLSANANSTNGVASVRIQRAVAGSGAYADVCTDPTAPYSCPWNTTAEANGPFDLRAVLTDNAGNTLASSVTTVSVDNSPLRALDVQAVNGGSIVGRVQAGDRITFTYSGELRLTSVASGWDGTPRAVTARLTDTGTSDTFSVDGVNLGSVMLGQSYVKSNKTVTFASTMTAATAVVGGVPRTLVTVTLGAQSGGGLSTAPGPGTMQWTPSTAVTNLAGTACSATPATESGTSDKDF